MESTLILTRKDLKEPLTFKKAEDIRLDDFCSTLRKQIQEANKVVFQDGNKFKTLLKQ